MKSSRYLILLLLPCVLFLAGACSEDSSTTTKEYMIGTVTSNFPSYCQMGSVVTAKAGGITYPEEVTWKWYASSMTTDTLVCNPVTLAVPDSIGEFGLAILACKDSFYVSSTSLTFQTVDTTDATIFYGPKKSAQTFTDPRDRFTYDIVTVGNLQWFAQNLAWDGAGVSYEFSPILDKYFGRYYTWDEASKACPAGWRLPSNDDWCDLASAVSGVKLEFDDPEHWLTVGDRLSTECYFLETRLWEYWPENEHKNTVGWNAVPTGCCLNACTEFANQTTYAFFWSSTLASADKAYYRYIFDQSADMPYAATSKDGLAMPARCVRDKVD